MDKNGPPIPSQQPPNLTFHFVKLTKYVQAQKSSLVLIKNTAWLLVLSKTWLAYSIQTFLQLKELGKSNNSDYVKQIYVKAKNCNPEPASMHIEQTLRNSKEMQSQLVLKHAKTNPTILTMWNKSMSKPKTVIQSLHQCI